MSMYIHEVHKFDRFLQETGEDLGYPTRHDVQAYIHRLLDGGKKPATIDRIYSTICVWAHFLGSHSIIEKIEKPKKPSIKHIRPKSLTGMRGTDS